MLLLSTPEYKHILIYMTNCYSKSFRPPYQLMKLEASCLVAAVVIIRRVDGCPPQSSFESRCGCCRQSSLMLIHAGVLT